MIFPILILFFIIKPFISKYQINPNIIINGIDVANPNMTGSIIPKDVDTTVGINHTKKVQTSLDRTLLQN